MKKMFGGGMVAGVLAALLFMGGMVAAGALGGQSAEDDANGIGASGDVSEFAAGPMIPESNYVAVTPCRVFDTRAVAAGAHENEVRHYDALGNLSAQGGAAAGCGIPSYANSITITITGVTPTGKGFMRGKAYDGSNVLPQATQLNYAPGIDASNTLTLPIAQGLSKEFSLGTFGNRVHLVGDVVGYFADPQYASYDITVSSITEETASRFLPPVFNSEGNYTLTAVGDVRGCAIMATGGHSVDNDTTANGTVLTIDGTTLVGGNTQIEVEMVDDDGTPKPEEFMILVQC